MLSIDLAGKRALVAGVADDIATTTTAPDSNIAKSHRTRTPLRRRDLALRAPALRRMWDPSPQLAAAERQCAQTVARNPYADQ